MQKQEGTNEDAMYPVAMSQDDSFEPGMAVMARFAVGFRGSQVIEQGTMGRIISQKGDPLHVWWDRIGDRPAAPSQLIPVVGAASDDDEEVHYPRVMRPNSQAQITEKEDVAEAPVLSLDGTEDNKAKEEAEKSKGKGGKGKKKR